MCSGEIVSFCMFVVTVSSVSAPKLSKNALSLLSSVKISIVCPTGLGLLAGLSAIVAITVDCKGCEKNVQA